MSDWAITKTTLVAMLWVAGWGLVLSSMTLHNNSAAHARTVKGHTVYRRSSCGTYYEQIGVFVPSQ